MRLLILPLVAMAWLLSAAPALADTEHVWSLLSRYGDSQHQGDWELGVLPGQDPSLSPLPGASLNHDWSSYGQGQDFTIKYDPATGLLAYTTQGATLITTLSPPDSVASYRLQIEAFANQVASEQGRVHITGLAVNGQAVSDELIVATDGTRAQSLALDNLPAGGFTITGKLTMASTHLAGQADAGSGWVPPGRQGGHTPPGHAYGHQGSHPPGNAYGRQDSTSTPTSLGSNLGAMFSLQAIKGPPAAGPGGGAAAAPEPATLLLAASGLGALALWRRRRSRSRP